MMVICNSSLKINPVNTNLKAVLRKCPYQENKFKTWLCHLISRPYTTVVIDFEPSSTRLVLAVKIPINPKTIIKELYLVDSEQKLMIHMY